MLVTRAQFREQVERIKDDAKKLGMATTVMLLVASDIDAICAGRMFMKLLMAEDIAWKLVPVSGYIDVQNEIKKAGEDIRSIIMVGCGGAYNVKAAADTADISPATKFYVFDSQKPTYHGNINDIGKIFVFEEEVVEEFDLTVPDDGDSQLEETESLLDVLGNGDEDEDEEAEANRDGEQLDADVDAESPSGKKRKRSDADSDSASESAAPSGDDGSDGTGESGDDSQADGEEEDEDGEGGRRRRRKRLRRQAQRPSSGDIAADGDAIVEAAPSQRRLDRDYRRIRREKLDRHKAYYAVNSHSIPASYQVWVLVEEMGLEARRDLLWLACVGVTDMLLTERISFHTYEACQRILDQRAKNLGGDIAKPTRDLEDTETGQVTQRTAFAGRWGHVAVSEEPRWVLHRHWGIRDAMIHSDYVSTRLDTYKLGTETGASQIDKLFSQTGIALKLLKAPGGDPSMRQARPRFFMKLKQLIDDPQYKLGTEMFFPSFVRVVEKEAEWSAGDVCAALSGLLSAQGTQTALAQVAEQILAPAINGAGSKGGAGAGAGPAGGSPGGSTTNGAREFLASWRHNWTLAFDSLGHKAQASLNLGVRVYKDMQVAILRLAPALVRSGRVHNRRYVRWIELDDGIAAADREIFQHPRALAALGRYVIRLCRDSLMKWRKKKGRVDTKPIVLTVHHPSKEAAAGPATAIGNRTVGWATVMGMPVPAREGEVQGPVFRNLFLEAAGRIGAPAYMDSFDKSSMVMQVSALERFMHAIDTLDEEADGGDEDAPAGGDADGQEADGEDEQGGYADEGEEEEGMDGEGLEDASVGQDDEGAEQEAF